MSGIAASRVLVTGATGLVGQAMLAALHQRGHVAVAACRRLPAAIPAPAVAVGDIDAHTDWREALAGCDAVVHLAARVHMLQDDVADPLAAYRRVNVDGTLNLARQAAAAGVRRLLFVSSIKVNGEGGALLYRESDPAAPADPYAISKWEAEQCLHEIAGQTGLDVVIVRPPLVYGPGVRANFLRLVRWVERGVPLPLASVDNRRSMIYLGNLVDALLACLTHPGAAGQTYLVSDGEDLSTPALIRLIAAGLGRPARLWPCPPALLCAAAAIAGKSAEADRLLGSLQVDSSRMRAALGWHPPHSASQGVVATVRALAAPPGLERFPPQE